MRKTLLGLVAVTGLLTVAGAASAAPLRPADVGVSGAVQQADWYCGPRCEYWRHRRWEERRWEEYHRWHPYQYGYNYNDYGYRYYYR